MDELLVGVAGLGRATVEGLVGILRRHGIDAVAVDDPESWVLDTGPRLLLLGERDRRWAESSVPPGSAVVVERYDIGEVAGFIDRGAVAAVSTDMPDEVLAAAVIAAAAGLVVVPGGRLGSLVDVPPPPDLTPGDLEVLRWLAAGRPVEAIADEAGYGRRAMFGRLQVLYRRLGVDNRDQAVAKAARHGWL